MIDRLLEHIRSEQASDGGFAHLSSFSKTDFSKALLRHTTFFTSNLLACLNDSGGRTADIKNAAATFLSSQKSERWSFNYWARGAKDSAGELYPPYPDDLDDTFAALTALVMHDTKAIDGEILSAVAKMLIKQEVQEGGPYRTWLVADDAPSKWQDVDIVTNATVGYFLSLIGVKLPPLEKFLSGAIGKHQLESSYYPEILHVGYFLSRFYKKKINPENADTRRTLATIIAERLQRRNNTEDSTPLEQAMAISSLINLGYPEIVPMKEVVELIVDRLERDGPLPYAFCIDPARGGKRCYAGASTLTAAFCIEALSQYSSTMTPAVDASSAARLPTIHNHIRLLARDACRNAGDELRAEAIRHIAMMKDEKVTGVAYYFREALYKNGKIVPLDIVEQLSLANLYGWMAYEMYDDALDGDGNSDHDDPSSIPCANLFLRLLTDTYSTLSARIPKIKFLFDETMMRVDNANAWEQKYCRIIAKNSDTVLDTIPQFGDHAMLADRSIGHAIGPLAELLFAGYEVNSQEYKNMELFFRHYLIARQIHDDAHDWAVDISQGRINCVAALILKGFKERYPDIKKAPPITAIFPQLRELFWKESIDATVRLIVFHITEARRARALSPILDGADFMENDLRRLEGGARGAIKERDDILIFLTHYKDPRRMTSLFGNV